MDVPYDESRVIALFAADPSAIQLGIVIDEVTPGRVSAHMDIKPEMLNALGIVHGGFVFTLGDSCFAAVCLSTRGSAVSRQADIIYINPAHAGTRLTAVGVESTRYGRNTIVNVRIHDDAGTHIAEMRVSGVSHPGKSGKS